ncbi:GNAT family N-acetyltransferase [Hathewaya limosa]|uniref:Spore coat polysaccharide biosynthesis protein SpsF n=1 Tax=Hathewaya limosa TaxID=1536 RepID=A0ABU0JQ75_HATLI|nr:GNAT family N-acetyltransferase [Hathewaya limosa]MDQ0479242.1 spore coat polysaccharide biosynthesis protein SpsF [Hathewaya limosa]
MNYYLKQVEEEDCDLLFEWANNKEVRKNSFNNTEISYDEHIKWFKKMILSPNVFMYIMDNGSNSVGQVRIDVIENCATISYSIDKEFRGQKLGTLIIKLIEKKIEELYEIDEIIGYVKKDNEPSKKIFKNLGYIEKDLNNKMMYYKRLNKRG